MDIRKHPACTTVIGAPSDMQDGSCSGLPVAYTQDEYGTWANSFWKPSPDELAALNQGGSIVLIVRAGGRQHPVVALGVTSDATEPA
jgi:hypothetical protein